MVGLSKTLGLELTENIDIYHEFPIQTFLHVGSKAEKRKKVREKSIKRKKNRGKPKSRKIKAPWSCS